MNPSGQVERYKARLVVNGCAQRAGLDYSDTYAPVARFESLLLVLATAVQKKYFPRQFDVKTAFLNGNLEEELFMNQPPGFNDGSGRVCRLKRSLYGLKQAPRCWNKKFDQFQKKFGLWSIASDKCVYVGKKLLLVIYVDDGLVAGESEEQIDRMLCEMQKVFKATSGPATHYLGLEIEQDPTRTKIHVHQAAYVKHVLERFNMSAANPAKTPAEHGLELSRHADDAGEPEAPDESMYRSLIGAIIYLQVATRPDLAHIVGLLCRLLANPRQQHLLAAKRVLRYLSGTADIGLNFDGSAASGRRLIAYTDADFAGCPDDRNSTSGLVLMLSCAPVIWSSRKQTITATSTTDAEYVSAHDGAKEAVWSRAFLKEIHFKQVGPTEMKVDNQAAVHLVNNPIFHRRT